MRRFIILACAVFCGGPLAAGDCKPINDPPPNVGLESLKQRFYDRQLFSALLTFEASDERREATARSLAGIMGEDHTNCVTLKRVVPSPHWISEVVMYEATDGILYLIISGEQRGDSFRMINFWFTGNFDDIRGMMY